MTKIELIVVM